MPFSAIPSLFSTIGNIVQGKKNFDMQQEQFKYQKELNEKVMQREDSAIQRQVADMQKAGFTKWGAGSGASSSSLVSAPAPQSNVDFNGLLSGIANIVNASTNAKAQKSQSAVNDQNIAESITRANLNNNVSSKLNEEIKSLSRENKFYDDIHLTRDQLEHLKGVEVDLQVVKELAAGTSGVSKLIAKLEGKGGFVAHGKVNVAGLIITAYTAFKGTKHVLNTVMDKVISPIISGAYNRLNSHKDFVN